MKELEPRIYDENNGLEYIPAGDYYSPNISLGEAAGDTRSIGKLGRMHLDYIREHKPFLYNELLLSCRLHSYLADLDEQAHSRRQLIVEQTKEAEGVTEELKRAD